MPEVEFTITWPDGAEQPCWSPSRAIERALVAGARYPVDEFVRRAGAALEEGGARVRAAYGFSCNRTAEQIRALRAGADRHGADGGRVAVGPLALRGAKPRHVRRGSLPPEVPVVVIGGGQAGLSVSWFLTEHRIEHLVLERDRAFSAWRTRRWDSFALVTPNWQCHLPGHHYAGDDPCGFMARDEVVAYLEEFRDLLDPPLIEGVAVRSVRPERDGGFAVATSAGTICAGQVVLATGGYHHARVPELGGELPGHVTQLHSSGYRNPASLPDGGVLVVGSGQSGTQIAEDLHLAGRRTHLAVGHAPRIARRYRGRDVVAWMDDMGRFDLAVEDHPMGPDIRGSADHYVTGRDGGGDIDLRAFAEQGMGLHGRLEACEGGVLRFADDLAENLDGADLVLENEKDSIDGHIARHGIEAPPEERYRASWQPAPGAGTALDLLAEEISTVVWATGFARDWSWVQADVFDDHGYPDGARGTTSVPGLYAVGLPWLQTWGSGRFAAICRDAEHVAGHVVAAAPASARRTPSRMAA